MALKQIFFSALSLSFLSRIHSSVLGSTSDITHVYDAEDEFDGSPTSVCQYKRIDSKLCRDKNAFF